MVMIKDGADAVTFDISDKTVNHNDNIDIKLLPKGGSVLWITKD
jgi:hypothetical protein